MKKWIDPDKKLPAEGQYCWVAYHPWNSPDDPIRVQPATWRDGLWILDGGGTSWPPVAWMPNSNEQPPEYKK